MPGWLFPWMNTTSSSDLQYTIRNVLDVLNVYLSYTIPLMSVTVVSGEEFALVR